MRSYSKFLVAAAVASACGYAAASSVSNTAARDYSAEALANASGTTELVIPDVRVSINDSFAATDHLLFTANTGVSFGSIALFPSALSCNGAGSVSFALDLTNSTSSQIRYNVTGTPGNTGGGARCDGNGVAAATGMTVVFRANTLSATRDTTMVVRRVQVSGTTTDVSSAGTILSVASEYSLGVASVLDGQIDVQGGRLSFTAATSDSGINNPTLASYDSFTVSVTRANRIQPATLSVVGSLQITLTATPSFAWLAEPTGTAGAGSCSISDGTGIATSTASIALSGKNLAFASGSNSGTCQSLIATFETIATGNYTIALGRSVATASLSSAFTTGTYSATSLLRQGAVSQGSSTANAGTWTLNGTTVNIPYLPTTTSGLQVMISNQSSQEGTIDFTAWNASGTTCAGSLGTIAANGNASVGTSLKAALAACSGSGWSTANRATVQLTVTTPSATTTVHSGFTANDGFTRSTVINNTNGK